MPVLPAVLVRLEGGVDIREAVDDGDGQRHQRAQHLGQHDHREEHLRSRVVVGGSQVGMLEMEQQPQRILDTRRVLLLLDHPQQGGDQQVPLVAVEDISLQRLLCAPVVGAGEVVQLLAYALLDAADLYRIRRVGIYLARQGTLVCWALDQLVATLADRASSWQQLQADFYPLVCDLLPTWTRLSWVTRPPPPRDPASQRLCTPLRPRPIPSPQHQE